MKNITKRIKHVEPKNKKQKAFLNALADHPVVLATGAAGAGKTFLAAYAALEALSYQFVGRIIIVRPIVATEQIGYLPGTFQDKIEPYLLPLMDSFITLTDPKSVTEMLEVGSIEIAALAYMRGRTLGDAFIILDEAQNTTIDQMKMFVTRFGENVKVVITGDATQSDIRGKNGLQWAIETFSDTKSVAHIKYESQEVVRSALARELLTCIEKSERHGSTNNVKYPDTSDSREDNGSGV